MNLVNKIGISNYLIDKASLEKIIIQSAFHKNLFIVGSVPIPPNPSELLIQKKIENMIHYLKENFDEINIDTPPIGLVTDAQILARIADASLYIIRQGYTYKEQVKKLDQLFQSKKFPRLNVLLNGVVAGANSSYGYGYGYGYGYYSDDVKHQRLTFKSAFKNIVKRF